MHVSLTPKLERFVRDKVESGDYNNNSEVIRDALRLFAEHEAIRREAILKALKEGEDAIARGDYTDYGPDEIGRLLDETGW